MIVSQLRSATALLAAIGLATIATIAQADPAGKWVIEFDSHADNDGEITPRVSPEGGAAVYVETKIVAPDSKSRSVASNT